MHTPHNGAEGVAQVVRIDDPLKPDGGATVVVLKRSSEAPKPIPRGKASKPTENLRTATKATAVLRRPRVAPGSKKRNKAGAGKNAPEGAKSSKPAKKHTRKRKPIKAEKVQELLTRPVGATLQEIVKATGWQPHSVRGFLSGVIRKKLGLSVESRRDEDGNRRYSVKD